MQQQQNLQKQNRTNAQRIAQLVRGGLMKASELPALKIAMMRHAKVGDVAKLPRNQRDVLNRYYQSASDAAIGSQQSVTAVRRNIQNGYEVSHVEKYWNDTAAFLMMAAILFIISQVFKKGIELQNENDLTV